DVQLAARSTVYAQGLDALAVRIPTALRDVHVEPMAFEERRNRREQGASCRVGARDHPIPVDREMRSRSGLEQKIVHALCMFGLALRALELFAPYLELDLAETRRFVKCADDARHRAMTLQSLHSTPQNTIYSQGEYEQSRRVRSTVKIAATIRSHIR